MTRRPSAPKSRASSEDGRGAPRARKPAAKQAPAGATASTTPNARQAAKSSAASQKERAKIRMYRHGLGDCFLITLPRAKNADPYRILIDCGVILGTPNAVAKMTAVLEDVVAVSKGKVDLLLATHQHWDHLSGFIQAEAAFEKLTVGEVWLAWTEDPSDALAQQLRRERGQALSSLRLSAGAMRMAGDADGAGEVENLIGFFGAAAGGTTEDALAKVAAKATVRYCRPNDPPTQLRDPAATIYVLGPPHDEKLIRKTLPSSKDPETYGIAANQLGAAVESALSTSDEAAPFSDNRAIPFEIARGLDFFKSCYFGPGEDAPDWRRIDTAWLDGASELALALDSATNNTSLVIVIELPGGDTLLFAADAQVGNWLSWQDLTWTFDGRPVTGPDLLACAIFYKVGHHGSHNATLREKGLAEMKRLSIAAIPVDHEMAVKKNWGKMPLPELVDALSSAAKDGVLRSDQAPASPPAGVEVKDLYFDISL